MFRVVFPNLNYEEQAAIGDAAQNVKSSGESSGEVRKKLNKTQERIMRLISENKKHTADTLAEKIGITVRGIEKNLRYLRENGYIIRQDSTKSGYWKIIR